MAHSVQIRPLTTDDATAMVDVLADPQLYEFTGGNPPTVDELTRRFEIKGRGGSSDGRETWLNWIVVAEPEDEPVGYVQATLTGSTAEIAWVIGAPWQGRGYAKDASLLMLEELGGHGTDTVIAHIHPDHAASNAIARRLGLHPTETIVDGEIEWNGPRAEALGNKSNS